MTKFASLGMLLGLAALVFCGAAHATKVTEPATSPTAKTTGVVVYTEPDGTVLRAYENLPVTDQFYLSITHPGMQTKTIKLPWGLMDVTRIAQAVDGKAIVIGNLNGSLSQVIIVDLKSDTMVDRFLAYGPVESPNGRYIAFTKFYPEHFAQGTSDIELVYDVAKSAQDNRPPGVKVSNFMNTNVGTGVYPPGATAETNNVGVKRSKIVRCMSDFIWSPDSSRLVFSVTHSLPPKPPSRPQNNTPPRRTKVSLVLVTFGPPSWRPATKVFTTRVCLDGIGTCRSVLRKVQFGKDGMTAFMQTMGETSVGKPRHIKYSQFHALRASGD